MRSDHPQRFSKNDSLNRDAIVQRIVRLCGTHSPDGSVLGVFGPWGVGKSSVLNFVAESLEREQGKIVIRLNPWHFNDSRLLTQYFFMELAAAMGRKRSGGSTPLTALAASFSTMGGILSGLPSGDPLSAIAGGVTKAMAEVTRTAADAEARLSFEQMREDVVRTLNEYGTQRQGFRIVVLIDEVDRLQRDELLSLLMLIRGAANLPHTTYVIAADAERMCSTLAGEEARQSSGRMASARAYLEKIVQMPINVAAPSASHLQAEMLHGAAAAFDAGIFRDLPAYENRTRMVSELGVRLRETVGRRCRSMRDVNRFLNALDEIVQSATVENPSSAIDTAHIVLLQIFYPGVYARIQANKAFLVGLHPLHDRFTFNSAQAEALRTGMRLKFYNLMGFDDVVDGPNRDRLDEEDQVLIEAMSALFPQGEQGRRMGDEEASEARRMCCLRSPERFDRYFGPLTDAYEAPDSLVQLLLSPDELPAAEVDKLIAQVDTNPEWTDSLSLKLSDAARVERADGLGVLVAKLAGISVETQSYRLTAITMELTQLFAKHGDTPIDDSSRSILCGALGRMAYESPHTVTVAEGIASLARQAKRLNPRTGEVVAKQIALSGMSIPERWLPDAAKWMRTLSFEDFSSLFWRSRDIVKLAGLPVHTFGMPVLTAATRDHSLIPKLLVLGAVFGSHPYFEKSVTMEEVRSSLGAVMDFNAVVALATSVDPRELAESDPHALLIGFRSLLQREIGTERGRDE